MNIIIDENAKVKINEIINEKKFNFRSFRLSITSLSRITGPVFDLVFDEANQFDQVYKVDDLDIIVDNGLNKRINEIEILYKEGSTKSGFIVNTDFMKIK